MSLFGGAVVWLSFYRECDVQMESAIVIDGFCLESINKPANLASGPFYRVGG